MTNKSLDGIKKSKIRGPANRPLKHRVKILKVDGLVRRQTKPLPKARPKIQPARYIFPFRTPSAKKSHGSEFLRSLYVQKRVPVLAIIVTLIFAFSGGMWAALSTTKTQAVDQSQASSTDPTNNFQVPLPGAELPPQNTAAVSNDVLFNTPIQELQNYLANVSQPDIIANRTAALTKFLTDMHSPFASAAGTIATQSHWQLILEISFAESTLGKNCTDNNCSNIGVGPNSPLWHRYASYQGWVVSFNKLLDERYNNWTLDQMCGVYVKPCTANWLTATKEIMTDLNNRGIN